jgi:hypothetical protein
VRVWTGFFWIKIRASGGSYEHGNECPGSIKDGKFLDQLSDYQFLKNDSVS